MLASTSEFVSCIQNEDAATLTRVPGIGKKTAERMIIDMRDRIAGLDIAGTSPGESAALTVADNPVQDAMGALIALGYKPAEASRAVDAIKDESEKRDDLIRNALQFLSKKMR